MLITQTPLRISLFGGGTDFEQVYRSEGGAVLSLGIDKYVYVIVKERFDEKIYVNYSKKEIVERIDDVQHEFVREAMRKTGVLNGVEITTLADVPSEGTGLGSSSSITVGLLNAFFAYRGIQVSNEELARFACEIEIETLGKPIGVQDQYIAAYGNLCFTEFRKDGTITVERLPLKEERKRELISNLLLFYTGRSRSSTGILAEQRNNIPDRTQSLRRIRDSAFEARQILMNGQPFDREIGALLHASWVEKKKLATGITDPEIDGLYDRALNAGALGGKIAGAGGGGFLLLWCLKDKQDQLRSALKGYRELPIRLSRDGSKVIFNISNHESK
jgi:D-glycero-alpha-D-manno-heptose-7-phosphate kinase